MFDHASIPSTDDDGMDEVHSVERSVSAELNISLLLKWLGGRVAPYLHSHILL